MCIPSENTILWKSQLSFDSSETPTAISKLLNRTWPKFCFIEMRVVVVWDRCQIHDPNLSVICVISHPRLYILYAYKNLSPTSFAILTY